MFQRLSDNALDDLCIDADQFLTRHARLARETGRHNNHIRTCRCRIVVRHAAHRRIISKGMCRLHHVHCLTFGDAFLDVDEDNFTCKLLDREDICYRSANVAGTNHSDFHKYFLLKKVLLPPISSISDMI